MGNTSGGTSGGRYLAIGLMSGTSVDGIDAALLDQLADSHALRIAEAYAWLGDMDQASAWLIRALRRADQSDFTTRFVALRSPFLKPVLDRVDVQQELRKLGMAHEQIDGIRFSLSLPGE